MLHELLATLLGFGGDDLLPPRLNDPLLDGPSAAAFVSSSLFHDSEKQQLFQIQSMGWFYSYLQRQVRLHQIHWHGNCSGNGGGFHAYKSAYYLGIHEILEVESSSFFSSSSSLPS
jgi:hypothetical protein